ncbi:hypothetical protein GWI33_014255 [Rhynchophorus ferrugineus]|uniref:Uncharacterized protein n=1 Tax=Rhynchophorus ferrugineus TaxID=354439 RepID=A0A834I4V4_RHYFE|nr:hypothetical protein GWI33_014255 [Rhynchophorus ferrugineus]
MVATRYTGPCVATDTVRPDADRRLDADEDDGVAYGEDGRRGGRAPGPLSGAGVRIKRDRVERDNGVCGASPDRFRFDRRSPPGPPTDEISRETTWEAADPPTDKKKRPSKKFGPGP